MHTTVEENTAECTYNELNPNITVNLHGKEIKTLDISLIADLLKNGQSKRAEKVGIALVQIISQDWVSEPIFDYIYSNLNSLPPIKKITSSHYEHLSFDERVKHHYASLDDALTCMDYGKSEIRGTIAVLHLITIHPHFRKKKLTRVYLWLILKTLKECFHVDYLLLQPSPIEITVASKAQYEKEKKRLEKIYAKSGFKKRSKALKKKDGTKISYMFQRINNRLFDTYNF